MYNPRIGICGTDGRERARQAPQARRRAALDDPAREHRVVEVHGRQRGRRAPQRQLPRRAHFVVAVYGEECAWVFRRR